MGAYTQKNAIAYRIRQTIKLYRERKKTDKFLYELAIQKKGPSINQLVIAHIKKAAQGLKEWRA